MALTKRDKAILSDLNRFRVMDRDSIAELHFGNLKAPQYAANNVLLRLVREGHVERSTHFQPYVYFPSESNIKKSSQKIPHFLAILNTYKEISKHGKVEMFQVEPKYGAKGLAEPDIVCIFRRTPFFIEVQKTLYSEKQMSAKLERYDDLFRTGIVQGEPWQNVEKPMFPHVLILSEQRYAIDSSYKFRIFQAQTFTQFLQSISKQPAPTVKPSNSSGVKVKIN